MLRSVRSLAILTLVACQEYNLEGSSDAGNKYNPPDLTPEKQVDEIVQVTVPAVDVLFVIDNSCSMIEEQAQLQGNFGEFMRYFTGSGLDYHVGVTSTDMDTRWNPDAGLLVLDYSGTDRYIDASYAEDDAIRSFRERASLGTEGSGDEKGKDAAWAVLVENANAENAGFLREEADLSIVIISDEPDYSDNVSINELSNWLLSVKPDGNTYFSSIVGLESRNPCETERGTGYLEVTALVGGISWDICDSDWSDLLAALGLQAAGLDDEFFLSLVPVEASIEVLVTTPDGTATALLPEEWIYSLPRNSVTLSSVTPEPLSVIQITYDVLASAQDEPVTETTTVE